MFRFTSSTPAQAPSLDERLTAADTTRTAALSVFTAALDDLDVAEAEALAVMAEAEHEAARLRMVAQDADEVAFQAASKRDALKGLLGL
jgi:truncated hemoglobin YjbI